MGAVKVDVRKGSRDDLPFVMSVERLPGYAALVGCWPHEKHLRKMDDTGCSYIIGTRNGAPFGFAILVDDGNGMGNLCLNRIAVADPEKGLGAAFLGALCDLAFADPSVFRFWLDVLPSNGRARHVYGKLGFAQEGLMRSALRFPDGERADLILMSLLRPDWQALPKAQF